VRRKRLGIWRYHTGSSFCFRVRRVLVSYSIKKNWPKTPPGFDSVRPKDTQLMLPRGTGVAPLRWTVYRSLQYMAQRRVARREAAIRVLR
jgi:hypothetical protein